MEEQDDIDSTQNGYDLVHSSYVLMVGYLISSIISTMGSIIVIRMITPEEYALISIAYIVPAILIPFAELGLNYASINFIARKTKENDMAGVRNIIKINLLIKFILGFILTFSVAIFSVFIAKEIYNVSDKRLYLLIQIASVGIVSTILYDTINAFLIGAQKMKLIQIGAIFHTSFRAIFSIILILLGFPMIGAMLGIVLSSLVTVIIYLFFLNKTFKIRKTEKQPINWTDLKEMFKYGYPLIIFSIIAGIESQVFLLILAYSGFINEVSYLKIAVVSSALIGILVKAISFSLFPIFSKIDWNNSDERATLIKYFQFSIKFGTLLIFPVALFLILFSQDIFPYIFGGDYYEASLFISIYFIIFLLVPLGSLSIPAFFAGQKKTREILYIELVFLISGIGLAFILISYFGGLGVVVAMVLASFFSVIFGNVIIRKEFGNELFKNTKNYLFIALVTIIAGAITFFIDHTITELNLIKGWTFHMIFMGILFIFFIIVYLLLIGIFSLITLDEIDFLVSGFEKFPIINKIIRIFAEIEKSIVRIRKNKK